MRTPPQVSHVSIGSDEALKLEGRLDAEGTAAIWAEAIRLAQTSRVSCIDVQAVDYCDSAGIVLLIYLQKNSPRKEGELEIRGLSPQFQALLPSGNYRDHSTHPRVIPFPEIVGRRVIDFLRDLYIQVVFAGELFITLSSALSHPKRIRWKTFWAIFESAGINALPIITLIGFLTGCILTFQSLLPLRQFGVDIFAVNLTALALLRELGPIMTAIVLAGRSGSAFAAEIGTMKVNQELDALTTMGIAPLPFLAVPRILAALATTPLLTIYMNGIGIGGGILAMISLGFSPGLLWTQLIGAVEIKDILSGILKSVFFGFLVSSIGCLRGLQTGGGAVAVGDSTTRSVVSGIVLVVVADAIFSAVFYALKF